MFKKIDSSPFKCIGIAVCRVSVNMAVPYPASCGLMGPLLGS